MDKLGKQQFAEVLLSRFRALDESGKYHFISCLMGACEDIAFNLDFEDEKEDPEFTEWAETIMEAIFPEVIGDIHYGYGPQGD